MPLRTSTKNRDLPITAEPLKPDEGRAVAIVIHHGTVERFEMHSTDMLVMWEEYARLFDYFWHLDDVYISLENKNGVTIRESEKRHGIEVTCGA